MLDGAARIREVVAAAARDGQPAIGITDHGNMYGVLDFVEAANDLGVKPVVGMEGYFVTTSRFDRPRRAEHDIYHLTLLAENNEGYRNLIKTTSAAFLDGFFYKPRIDFDLLDNHHAGLIATTGCLGGVVCQLLLQEQPAAAIDAASRFQDIFGRDNFFIELQDHGLPEQQRVNPQLLDIARRIQAPLLATNDSHYVHKHDAEAHDALLCVQTGATRDDPKRFKFDAEEFYLKTAVEMRSLFAEVPEACDNTLWIAERANVNIEFGQAVLPSFPVPDGSSEDAYLRELTYAGARERYGSELPAHVVERLEYELGVISDMGFSAYFLVVWDLVRYAKENGIRVGPGRGSAAGSCVAYALRIVDIDPIRYDLLFERFLNPGRKQMPDIDMDFDERYRGEMIRYAAHRYGSDHVAQIVTFSTIKARAAVRDASRVLGYPYGMGDKIAKLMPPLIMGRDTPLYACLEKHPKYEDGYKMAGDLRELYEADPDARRVIEVARGLEGLRRQDGIHAAAVVITREPLTEYLPIQRKPEPGGKPEDAPIVTQYEMHGVEELGLLKMDFLGLRNLSVIERAVELIVQSTGEKIDIDAVPLDDTKTFEMLQRGDSIGVFQLEGGPMRALMRSLAPTSFEDVAALVALYRPGPMAANMHNDYADRKNGRKPVAFLHPDAEEILGPTYGLCLAGDTIVLEAFTGRPARLDEIAADAGFWVQCVGDDYGYDVRQVTDWRCTGERETFTLTLTNGLSVTGTADHPVMSEGGWKNLGDLTSNDYVAVPKKLVEPWFPQSMSGDRLRVLGNLIGDGGLSVSSQIVFTNTDTDVLDAFRRSFARAFPTMKAHERTATRQVTRLTLQNGKGHGGGASPLLRWLRELGLKAPAGASPGGVKSAEKFVPDLIFALDDESVARFVAALWDCDGHVNTRFATYRTVSRRLARDVELLLMRLGIASTIYEDMYQSPTTGEWATAYQVSTFDGRQFSARVQPLMASSRKGGVEFSARTRDSTIDRRLVLESSRSAWKVSGRGLMAFTGVGRHHLSQAVLRSSPRMHMATARPLIDDLELSDLRDRCNVQWVQVASVLPAGRQKVYDITVDELHNFVANGIVVHNCIFQEQLMRVAQRFAGYSLTEADNLRKACGKKIRDVMANERKKFVQGCEQTGYGATLGERWFDIIEPFADYAFNKSHSVGYGFVSYQTAYLKANYPVQYFAALLTSVKSDKDATANYLSECRKLGIAVLVPDVNLSESDFIARIGDDGVGAIPFGLSAIRNVGEGLVAQVITERTANGPFRDFYDFCERVDPSVLNKRAVESLVKAGAFDAMGHPRKGLLQVFERVIDQTLARRRERDAGVMSLFGDLADGGGEGVSVFDDRIAVPDIEFDQTQRLVFEKEMLGLYVSDHPLMGAQRSLARYCECTLTELKELKDGDLRIVGGVVTSLGRKYTKRGDLMATFVLEDLEAAVEVMVFPKTMAEYGPLLQEDAIVCVKGRLDLREDVPKIIAMEITRPEITLDTGPAVRVRLPASTATGSRIDELKKILLTHPGDSPVFVHLENGDRTTVLRLGAEFSVSNHNGLYGELRMLLGPNCIA
jgi:DNA polymerase-3 subunit alpha